MKRGTRLPRLMPHKLDDFVLRLALYGLDFLKADEAGMNAQRAMARQSAGSIQL